MSILRKKNLPEKSENMQPGGSGNPRFFAPWVLWGLVVCCMGSVVFSCFYDVFRTRAREWEKVQLEENDNISWLYQSSYVLYRDLYNLQNETQTNYDELYLVPDEGCEWAVDRELLTRVRDESYDLDRWTEETEDPEDPEGIGTDGEESASGSAEINVESAESLISELENMEGYFLNLEGNFKVLNSIYDYVIRDDVTGRYVTNMSEQDTERLLADLASYNRYFLLSFRFDAAGNVFVGEVKSEDAEQIRKTANEVIRENTLTSLISNNLYHFSEYGKVAGPKNCTVVFAASEDRLMSRTEGLFVHSNGYFSESGSYDLYFSARMDQNAYLNAGVGNALFLCMCGFALLALLLPVYGETKPWNDTRLCSLPFEFLFGIGLTLFASGSLAVKHVVSVAGGKAADTIVKAGLLPMRGASVLVAVYNVAVLTLFFFCCWYLGVCAKAVTERGVRKYIRQRSLVYRFFPFIKRKVLGIYHAVSHLDLTKEAHGTILKLLIINAIVLFIICSLWFGGFLVTVIYSALLYLILRKYISDLQKKYRLLLKATNEMAEGNLNVIIEEDLGVFEPFKPQIIRIQNGFRRAVDEEVKSQKMKAELITNVSHDLKTPLTAIITYVNLLKEDGISEQQRKEYLNVLEKKSLRLKVLIEDLFEVSKANSQNITLNLTEVDIMSLLKQVSFEMSDRWEEQGLDVRMNLTEEKVLLSLDSQKTYRIYENLFGNIAKYALPGTRVYVNGFRIDDTVVITLKNISAQEITVASSELTERFVRGDASRNTEGSGLGLAIAKSFTELQGGELSLEVDGDLFKATTVWKLHNVTAK